MGMRDRSRSPHGSVDQEVMGLIFQREQARQAKDFASADHLRQRLQELGVTLFDKTNTWRSTDGRSGRIPTFAELEAGLAPEAILTPEAGRDFPGSEVEGSEAHIKSLVQQREQARALKDFDRSDQLRDELKNMGIEVNDKEKLWRSKDGRSGIVIGYKGTPTDMEITTLVTQREKARQANDYAMSDMIRDELKQFNITIDDKSKVWRSADGRQGAVPSWGQVQGGVIGAIGQPAMMPMMAAAPVMPMRGRPAAGVDVTQQLMQAAMYAASNPLTAARALALLQQHGLAGPMASMGVVGMHTMVPVPAATPLRAHASRISDAGRSPEASEAFAFIEQCKRSGHVSLDPSQIDWLVGLREKVRQNKDFRTADELRDVMKSALGIDLHEKEKRWQSSDGLQGNIPSWSQLM